MKIIKFKFEFFDDEECIYSVSYSPIEKSYKGRPFYNVDVIYQHKIILSQMFMLLTPEPNKEDAISCIQIAIENEKAKK